MITSSHLQAAKWPALNFALGGALALGIFYGTRYAFQELHYIRKLTEVPSASSTADGRAAETSTTAPTGSGADDLATSRGGLTPETVIEDVPDFFNRETEDAISEDTLETLAFGPNLDMAESARRLILERVGRSPMVWQTMIANIAGQGAVSSSDDTDSEHDADEEMVEDNNQAIPLEEIMANRSRIVINPIEPQLTAQERREQRRQDRAAYRAQQRDELQERALSALKYFYHRSPLPHRERTLRAVVRSLSRRLPEVARRRHDPDTDWRQRTPAERDALFILRWEAEVNLDALLSRTGLVERWLARYPFGGPGATPARRQHVVRCLIDGLTDDDSLNHILHTIWYDKNVRGRQLLRAAGLMASVMREGDGLTSATTTGSGMDLGVRSPSNAATAAMNEHNLAGLGDEAADIVDGVTLYAPPETPPNELLNPADYAEDQDARTRRRRRNTVVAEPSAAEELDLE